MLVVVLLLVLLVVLPPVRGDGVIPAAVLGISCTTFIASIEGTADGKAASN